MIRVEGEVAARVREEEEARRREEEERERRRRERDRAKVESSVEALAVWEGPATSRP